jgi:phospholipid/cholesterol/gamma-HCH transport system substrate-binding protein
MLSQRTIESFVGLFLLAAIGALLVLAFKVSGLTSFFKPAGYDVTAAFDDIGQLKVRSPVKVGGVLVGEVSSITLDPSSFKAVVKLHINSRFSDIPDDSSVGILTAGLLGDNYIAITPMYSPTYLKNGSEIQDTHSAMILEKLIGQMIYKLSNPSGSSSTPATDKASSTANPTTTDNATKIKTETTHEKNE